ncbi:MAG: hypothetical protein K2K87_02290 [Lachnospiraceae bacterium]|nr:hypothetical protein [Lachnospiraceae bacterium]
MLCNPASSYPDKIDEMLFFQDNPFEKEYIINHYENLISQGKYSEAERYLNQQEPVYGLFADFLNLIENRIFHLQEYVLGKPPKKQPFFYYDSLIRYLFGTLQIFTDLEAEEDTAAIFLFSDLDEQESTDGLELLTEEEEEPPLITADMIWI